MLVSDLLDLSKLRAGVNGEEKRAVFNLSEEVCGVTERFSYLTETEGYTIETDVEEGLYTEANKERIAQVFYNLIGNAINYTGEDKRVRVKLYRKGNNARFEVIDTGKGIPADEVDTIWDRYYRSGGVAQAARERYGAWPFHRKEYSVAARLSLRSHLRAGEGELLSGRSSRLRRRKRRTGTTICAADPAERRLYEKEARSGAPCAPHDRRRICAVRRGAHECIRKRCARLLVGFGRLGRHRRVRRRGLSDPGNK